MRIEDAIRFHLNVIAGARTYDPIDAGVPGDSAMPVGPPVKVTLLDPAVRRPKALSPDELEDLVAFVRDGLLDPRVNSKNLCQLVTASVPSGRPELQFEASR